VTTFLRHSVLLVLLAIERSPRCQMCELRFKFEEDRTKMWSLSRTIGISGRQTDRHSN